MDIHIQLAGVQLGPYSDKQIREYIAEGLLSMADKARIDGTLDWIPVSELVEKLPPLPAPAPTPDPDAVFSDAEPVHTLAAQVPAAPASGPQGEERLLDTPAPDVPPAKAPDIKPDFSHARVPERGSTFSRKTPAEVDPYTAKTAPLAPPPSTSASGTVKTKPLGPLAPTAPVPKGKGLTASKSVSTTAPLAQATNKLSRTALARALQNKTEPLPGRATISVSKPSLPPQEVPAVAVTAPDTTGPMASGAAALAKPAAPTPAAEPKKGGLPSLLRALTAKTVPMRGAAPAPPSAAGVEIPPAPGTPPPGRTTMPVTTPLPTRAIMNPAAIRANRSANPPPASPPSAPPAATPVSEVEAPTEKLPVSKKAAELRAKAVQRAAEREAALAPPVPEAKPAAPRAIEPAPDQPAVTPASEPVPDEPAAPRAPRRRKPVLLVLCAVVAIAGAYYVWSPYHASDALRTAMANGSAADLGKMVDFEAVRASLKAQAQQLAPGADVASADAPGIVDKSIDGYVTPDGIAGLVAKARDQKSSADLITPDVASNLVTAFVNQPLRNQGLTSPTDFVLQTDVANLHLSLQGLGWKLTRIDVRPDLTVPATAAGAPLGLVPVVQSYLQRGSEATDAKQWAAAIGDYTQALTLAPQSTDAYVSRAGAHLANGDLDDAIKDYSQALTIDPAAAGAYNGRGKARMAKKDLDGAIGDFTQAVKADPTMAIAYDNRGNAESAKNDLEGAIRDFTQAIAIDPTLASAFSDRALARQSNGNLDGAVKDYTDALALKPNDARTYFNRGLARLSQNNLSAAILDFDHALAIDPKIPEAWFQRGNAKSALHDTDGAIADFTHGLALDAGNALAYCSRGVAREDKGDLDGAQADYSKALTLDPKIAVAYFRRALIEVRRGNPDGAIADTTQSLDLDGKNTQAYYYRGFAKLLRGNLDGASSDFQLFCEGTPHDRFADNARLYLWLIAKQQPGHADPDQDLSDALENSWNNSADDFTSKTAAFLLGRVTESDYLTDASSTDAGVDATQHCQAWYFAGMKRILMADRNTANDYFQKCVATGKKDFCEYILAQAQLQPPPPPAPVPDASTPSVVPAPVAPTTLPATPAPNTP